MKITHNLFEKYRGPLRVFVETGTLNGDGCVMAELSGFEFIFSIEIDDALYKRAVDRFGGDEKINILHGDSALILPQVIAALKEPALFWLDAHHSGGSTGGKGLKPVYDELAAIRASPYRHIILIDDIRDFGFDKCKALIKEDYNISLETGDPHFPDNILVCIPKENVK